MLKGSQACIHSANTETQTPGNTSTWLLTAGGPRPSPPHPHPQVRGSLSFTDTVLLFSPRGIRARAPHQCNLAHLHLVSHYNF